MPEKTVVGDLFDERDRAKDNALQRALDHICDKQGRQAVLLGTQLPLASEQKVYKVDHQSPLYTTDINQIIHIKAG